MSLNQHLMEHEPGSPTSKRIQETVSTWVISKEILSDALLSTLGLLFIFVAETINILFVSSLKDTNLLNGIGIGTLFVNAVGYVIGIGMIGGLDTLCCQTFGARRLYLMGVYYNVTKLCISFTYLLFTVPLSLMSFYMLTFIGQKPGVAIAASKYVLSMIPSTFFGIHFNITLRFLQSMNIFLPGMIVTFVTSVFHLLWCYVFITLLDFNVIGAGISMCITQGLNYVLLAGYLHYKNPYPESYFFFNRDCFKLNRIKSFFNLAAPSAILFAADWMGFETLTLLASYLNENSFAAMVCFINFMTLVFVFPMGLGFSSTTLVGNYIGAMKIKSSIRYTKVSLGFGAIVSILNSSLIYIFIDFIPLVYTQNKEIQEIMKSILYIYLFCVLPDVIQFILYGIIKGLGKQTIASFICLGALYPFNIPCAWFFAFYLGKGVIGLWYSQALSLYILTIGYSIVLWRLDWNQAAQIVAEQYRKEEFELASMIDMEKKPY